MSRWLPSESAWIDTVAERLLEGKLLLVRAPRRWGLSAVGDEVTERLAGSCVQVNGKEFTEENQGELRDAIEERVLRAVERDGCAQLIFDDLGEAFRRSQGGRLHSALYRMLIDAPWSRDVGALLIAKTGDMLDYNFAGSPLMGRVEHVPLPRSTEDDFRAVGLSSEESRFQTGESTWLLRFLLGRSRDEGELAAVESLTMNRRAIASSIPPKSIEFLVGARQSNELRPIDREALRCFGGFNEQDEYQLAKLVELSQVPDEIHVRSPRWPDKIGESIAAFARLLEGSDNAIWVDRYLMADPSRAFDFISALRTHTNASLRLLVSDESRQEVGYTHRIRQAFGTAKGVHVRFMARFDRRELHDRHLVLPKLRSGFVLPTARVILGLDPPGSAVCVRLSQLPINYNERWERGTPVA